MRPTRLVRTLLRLTLFDLSSHRGQQRGQPGQPPRRVYVSVCFDCPAVVDVRTVPDHRRLVCPTGNRRHRREDRLVAFCPSCHSGLVFFDEADHHGHIASCDGQNGRWWHDPVPMFQADPSAPLVPESFIPQR